MWQIIIHTLVKIELSTSLLHFDGKRLENLKKAALHYKNWKYCPYPSSCMQKCYWGGWNCRTNILLS